MKQESSNERVVILALCLPRIDVFHARAVHGGGCLYFAMMDDTSTPRTSLFCIERFVQGSLHGGTTDDDRQFLPIGALSSLSIKMYSWWQMVPPHPSNACALSLALSLAFVLWHHRRLHQSKFRVVASSSSSSKSVFLAHDGPRGGRFERKQKEFTLDGIERLRLKTLWTET